MGLESTSLRLSFFLLFPFAFSRVFLGWGRGDVKYIGVCIGLGVFLQGRWLLGCFLGFGMLVSFGGGCFMLRVQV